MEKVRVIICPEKTQGIIHPNIFSHNLEHTRSCIYQGLSAQILRNRKFAGKPAAHSGQAAELAEGKYISRWIALMPM